VGNQFTLADLNTASVASICPMIGVNLTEYTNIANWLGAISDRPAFQKFQALRQ
jgi:glutathione S-transferase